MPRHRIVCSQAEIELSCQGSIEQTESSLLLQDRGALELRLRGDASFIWPNREGEEADLDDAMERLRELDPENRGICISYPATASAKALLFKCRNSRSYLLHCKSDPYGRSSEIRIQRESEALKIRFGAMHELWHLDEISEPPSPHPLERRYPMIQHLFQLGCIGPDGKTSIDPTKGFMILKELLDQIADYLDPRTVMFHLFGYAEGHDRAYPDYTPSKRLGGMDRLKKGADALHHRGAVLSCYLNARIIEESQLNNYPALREAVCRDSSGEPLREFYHGKPFLVMHPNAASWRSHLLESARDLRKAGADVIQLDQVAGRQSPLREGEPWGSGYRDLIKLIQDEGLGVWIQGSCDLYPADWFELTYRNLSILEEGILRGGCPFGRPSVELLSHTVPSAACIVPRRKQAELKGLEAFPLVTDELGDGGRLPLYNKQYREELATVLSRYQNQ